MMILSKEESYIESLREQVKAQAKYIDEIRAVKHDMYAHMMVLNHYIREKDCDRASNYLLGLMNQDVFQQSQYVDMGNDMLNALLLGVISKSKGKVRLLVSGEWNKTLPLEDIDVCILFSNLLSNSLEACERLIYTEKVITLNFEQSVSGISLDVRNPVELPVDVENFGEYTTKKDSKNHGYGVKNIKRVVEKYAGELSITYENGLVSVKVGFPCVAERAPL